MRVIAALYGAFFLAAIPNAISPWGALSFGARVQLSCITCALISLLYLG
jgi:hypothetical protein